MTEQELDLLDQMVAEDDARDGDADDEDPDFEDGQDDYYQERFSEYAWGLIKREPRYDFSADDDTSAQMRGEPAWL